MAETAEGWKLIISPTEEAILRALAHYRYLTAGHLLQLGVSSAPAHLYAVLRSLVLRKPAIVTVLDFGAVPKLGRLPRLYALTQRGADLLRESDPALAAKFIPKRLTLFHSDYLHRLRCIDFHILFSLWAERQGFTTEFFETYYDATGKAGEQKTRVPLRTGVLVPDAVFAFTDQQGSTRLFSFELYNGRRTERVVGQLETYRTALLEEAIEERYDAQHAVRVLCVFDDPVGMRLVQERLTILRGSFEEVRGQLFFRSLADMPSDFVHGWQRFDREVASLF